MLEALINACRADLKHALAGHSMSAKAKQKSMKTLLSKDFVILNFCAKSYEQALGKTYYKYMGYEQPAGRFKQKSKQLLS